MSSDNVKETRTGGKSEKVLKRNDKREERGDIEKQHLDQNNKNQNVKAHQLMKKYHKTRQEHSTPKMNAEHDQQRSR